MSYIKIGNKKIENIKFAITEEEQRNGLMFSKWVPDIMVFPYKKAEVKKFWMSDVSFPLDIIFCKGGKIVDIVIGKLYDKTLIGPNKKCDCVIETPGGYCAYNNVKIGDDLTIKYDKEILEKFLSS